MTGSREELLNRQRTRCREKATKHKHSGSSVKICLCGIKCFHSSMTPKCPIRLVLPPSHTRIVLREIHRPRETGKSSRTSILVTLYLTRCCAHMSRVCGLCTLQPPLHNPKAPLQPITTSYQDQRLGVDIVGPFPQSRKGNRYLLVMVDFVTK
uniref:Pro-Pol polyprotein n=1 Tax=Schistocephalus solidus TaxID=70667 RepID=A0A0X3PHZ3_SCHSO